MEYHRPETIPEASSLLAEANAKVIAGGQSLMPLLRQDIASPDALVDITRIEGLSEVRRAGGTLEVGALVTYGELLEADAAEGLDLLGESLEAIGDRQVRNAGTIGGGVAHADPAQDLPPALLCYGTEVVIRDGEDERRLDVGELFVDFYFTELAPTEIVTRVDVDLPPEGAGGAFEKHARTPGGFSEAGVACLLVPGEGGYREGRLAYCAGAPVPRRAPPSVEERLAGEIDGGTLAAAADGLVDSLELVGDVDDDPAYTEHVFGVLTERAIRRAASRSAGPGVDA